MICIQNSTCRSALASSHQGPKLSSSQISMCDILNNAGKWSKILFQTSLLWNNVVSLISVLRRRREPLRNWLVRANRPLLRESGRCDWRNGRREFHGRTRRGSWRGTDASWVRRNGSWKLPEWIRPRGGECSHILIYIYLYAGSNWSPFSQKGLWYI